MPIKYPSFRSNTGGQTDSSLDLIQNSALIPLTSEHPNAKNVRLVNGIVYGTATKRNEEQAESFPITFELRLNYIEGETPDTYKWSVVHPNGDIVNSDQSNNNRFEKIFFIEQNGSGLGEYIIRVSASSSTNPNLKLVYELPVQIVEPDVNRAFVENGIFSPYRGKIIEYISPTQVIVDRSINNYGKILAGVKVTNTAAKPKWVIKKKFQNIKDFTTLLRFGNDRTSLAVNYEVDTNTFPNRPNSIIYKTYKPIDESVNLKDNAYVVREMIPPIVEKIKLVEFQESDLGDFVLRQPNKDSLESPVQKRPTDFKNYNTLIGSGSTFVENTLRNNLLSGSTSVNLNIDYNNYENFTHFGSANERVKNFKLKLESIQSYSEESQSLLSFSGSDNDIRSIENKRDEVINNFDGYERYLYQQSSSASTSSLGQFFDTAWPKVSGAGTLANPYRVANTTSSLATNWYSLNTDSASLYDDGNPTRLVNLLPEHVKADPENETFLRFMDMVGQYFDEIWVYIKALSDVTDRRQKITEGLAKDLAYDLAKSYGWELNSGKDLLELSQYKLGLNPSGSSYPTYSVTAEEDIEKEIWKRILLNIPYFLKTKGTAKALKALVACYGVPSTILRIKEYGGLNFSGSEATFDIKKKFTKSLDFKSGQFVSSSWENVNSVKPHTVEIRFKSPTGSNQTLVQKDNKWALRLKDNGSIDNKGFVSFMISGSSGYKEISSSLLPIYDNDFYSVMLRKKIISHNHITPFTQSLAGTIFADGARNGTLTSHSGSEKLSEFSLRHTATAEDSFTLNHKGVGASFISASLGKEVEFSAQVAASASNNMEKGDAKVQLQLFELDSAENVVEFAETDFEHITTDFKRLQVRRTVSNPRTITLSLRLKNQRENDTVFYDNLTLVTGSTAYGLDDDISDDVSTAYNYELFVKKYDSGRSDLQYESKNSLLIDGSVEASHSYNGSWSGSGHLFIGGSGSAEFGAPLSGSLMEFRLWTTPLMESKFNNHVAAPKAINGNHPSASFTELPVRFSFDDNKNLSTDTNIPNVAPDQTTFSSTGSSFITGSAVGFADEVNFSSVEDEMKMFIPNAGPNRRNAKKIRIESSTISTSSLATLDSGSQADVDNVLFRNNKEQISEFDELDVESNKLGLYFSPVDVVNEDIILSTGDLDFNQFLGDPRDQFELEYRGLKDISNKYFQKYSGKNNFWDYLQTVKYYDQSMWQQFKKLIPAKAKATLGTLIEGNIFERPKEIIGKLPEQERVDLETEINVGILEVTQSDFRPVISLPTQSVPTFDGTISESRLRESSVYYLNESASLQTSVYDSREGRFYVTASVRYGQLPNSVDEPTKFFSEAIYEFVSGSQFSERYDVKNLFFSASSGQDQYDSFLSGSLKPTTSTNGGAHSSSFSPSPFEPISRITTAQRRLFFEGIKNTPDTTIGAVGGNYNVQSTDPIEVFGTAPTAVAKAPPGLGGDSRLVINKSDNVRQAGTRFGSGLGLNVPLPPAPTTNTEGEKQFDDSETAGIADEFVNTPGGEEESATTPEDIELQNDTAENRYSGKGGDGNPSRAEGGRGY